MAALLRVFLSIVPVLVLVSTNASSPRRTDCATSLPTPLSTFVAGHYDDTLLLIGGVFDQYGATPNRLVHYLNISTLDGCSSSSDLSSGWQSLSETPPGICCLDTQHKQSTPDSSLLRT